jgi:serine protease Do
MPSKDEKPVTQEDNGSAKQKEIAASEENTPKPIPSLTDLQQSLRRFSSPPTLKPHQVQRAKSLGVVLLLIASLSLGFLGGWIGAGSRATTNIPTSTQKEVVLSESQLVAQIAKDVGPSVVSVNVTSQSTSSDLFGFLQSEPQQSAGTGIILSSDGVIVTNRHVVPAGTTSVSVTLADGTTFNNVQVIGRTNESDSLDIAFLKIPDTKGKKLVPAQIGDSSKVQIGDRVVAIGNALGQFQNTVTSGIISGYGRTVQASDQGSSTSSSENLEDLFQTDAAINEGNSGGPLVNSDGQVIGINTALASNAQGLGFAIPINDVKGLMKTVLATGKFEQPYLGVRYLSLTNDYAKQLNLSIDRGAYIIPSSKDNGQAGVISGSPADKAGLKEGDIITAVNGTNIDSRHSLTSLLDQYSVGDTVNLTVMRDGKQISIQATLESASSSSNS